ncbi:MAG: FAD-dependent oxidoreductase [Chloroflexi bacterium]|nr:FAD-dependent oxidoreductase [Chloroflexota bacterium]
MAERVYDVLVIGAGIGGLTAAALCADTGLDVAVLEGHTRPGGCAGDFLRRGILFPAGATVVLGFEPGGLHRWVYERLDIPISALPLDTAMTVHLPDRQVTISTDRRHWEHERQRAFPSIGPGGDRFWADVRRLADTAHDLAAARPSLPLQSVRDLWNAARLARPSLLAAAPTLWQSVADLLASAGIAGDVPHRRFVDNQLLISMQCLADEAVAMNGALALDVYRRGVFHLPHGTATIAQDLVRALEARGAACHFRTWVRRVQRTLGLWAVTTADDDRLLARTVIANIPTPDLALMVDEPPPQLVRAPHERVQPWGAVVCYAALDATDLPGPFPQYHQIVETYSDELEDGASSFLSIFGPQPPRHPSIATLSISTHTRVDPWWRLASRPAYLERKARIGERLLAAAERVVPGLRGKIIFSEVATPRGYWRWTGRHEGRVGGVPQSLRHANLRAQSHRTGLPGLFQCGDSVFPGQGTIGVTLSGLNASRDALRHLDEHRRRTRAGRGRPGGRAATAVEVRP